MYSKEAKEHVIKLAAADFVCFLQAELDAKEEEKVVENLTNLCVGTAFARSDFHHISSENNLKSHYMISENQYEVLIDIIIDTKDYCDKFYSWCMLDDTPTYYYLASNFHFATMIVLFMYFYLYAERTGDKSYDGFFKSVDSLEKMSKNYCDAFLDTEFKPELSDVLVKQNLVHFERAEKL